MYNDPDEVRKVLNEVCIEIATTATDLSFGALQKESIFHTNTPSTPAFLSFCLRLKENKEDVFFEMYKQSTQALAPLFYNNSSPAMLKDSLLVFWKRMEKANPMLDILRKHHMDLLQPTNKTEEAERYRQTKRQLDKYTSLLRNTNIRNENEGEDVTQARKELFSRAEVSVLPLRVLTEGLHDTLEKISVKVQEISDIQSNFMSITIPQKEPSNEPSPATLILSKRERGQSLG